MTALQKWIVCEQSGRWAAALRVAFTRLPKPQSTPRLRELRTIEELSTHADETGCDLALIEVGQENLKEVLQWLLHRGTPQGHFVALMNEGDSPRQVSAALAGKSETQPVVDLLWEVGALEVVETPRQLSGLLALHHRLAAARGQITAGLAERQSFTDWAWSTLPWQDP